MAAPPRPPSRHAALCRIALPNFCLKLNSKERNPTRPREPGLSSTGLFLRRRRRGGGWVGMGCRLAAPLPRRLGPGQGRRFRPGTGCSFLRLSRNAAAARRYLKGPRESPRPPPAEEDRELWPRSPSGPLSPVSPRSSPGSFHPPSSVPVSPEGLPSCPSVWLSLSIHVGSARPRARPETSF